MEAALVIPNRYRWFRLVGRALLAGVFSFGLVGTASAQSFEDVRAVFLFNFARNVTWPESSFTGGDTPIRVGIVGNPRVARALERTVKGRDANGREVRVVVLDSALGCESMHMVYIGNDRLTGDVLAAIGDRPILTVSEAEDFIDQGGMIRLVTRGNTVGCMINTSASDDAGLKLSERLVRVGDS